MKHRDIYLELLTGEPIEMKDLQGVFEQTLDYSMRIMGHPPGPAEAQSTFSILPPDKSYEDKFVFGIYRDNEMIGCVDLIRSYPDRSTAMLGLLLLTPNTQRKGYGKFIYQRIEEIVKGWSDVRMIRIGVVGTNSHVLGFWEKMGFSDTTLRKPYRYDKLESEHIIYEKKIEGTNQ